MNESDSSDALVELLTLTLTVDKHGTRIYRNSLGQYHRIHGPALEYTDGSKSWYLNGQLHSTDGPAREWANGTRRWYLNGEYLTEREFHERIKRRGG